MTEKITVRVTEQKSEPQTALVQVIESKFEPLTVDVQIIEQKNEPQLLTVKVVKSEPRTLVVKEIKYKRQTRLDTFQYTEPTNERLLDPQDLQLSKGTQSSNKEVWHV